jgi:NADPH2:quinone reductase
VDYTKGAIAEKGEQYDLIFDTVGVTTFAQCKGALSEKGTYLPLNSSLTEIGQAILTSWGAGKRVKYAISQNTREGLELLVSLIESGVLKPVIDHVYPMEQIAQAHRRVEERHKRGSVVVTIAALDVCSVQ